MEKNHYIQKNMYILKLLLNIVTTGTEALVILGNKFCMPVSKKSAACELSHILTPSINSSLLLKCCDPRGTHLEQDQIWWGLGIEIHVENISES
jgi:hypothetical protein